MMSFKVQAKMEVSSQGNAMYVFFSLIFFLFHIFFFLLATCYLTNRDLLPYPRPVGNLWWPRPGVQKHPGTFGALGQAKAWGK